jgi:peptidoglycan/xylan/chitin deacetylase (PgdA/CDA1 family)
MDGTLVLMYHGIGDDPAPRGELRYTVSEAAFAAALEELAHRQVVSLPFFLDGRARAGSVVITFDDGERSVLERALPLMEARGLRGAVYVTSGWIGAPGYLAADDLRLLESKGWTIGAHGVSHRYLPDLSGAELRAELAQARADLERALGHPAVHMSLPGGRADARVLAAAHEAGYLSLATSHVGWNESPPDAFAIRRVMVLREWSERQLRQIVEGAPLFYLALGARQGALDAAKRVLGNQRYESLRESTFRAVGAARSLARIWRRSS